MTANQLERFARAHRQVTPAEDAAARARRRLAWRVEEDGSLSGMFRLPPFTRWPRTLPYGRPYRMLAIHSAAASVSG